MQDLEKRNEEVVANADISNQDILEKINQKYVSREKYETDLAAKQAQIDEFKEAIYNGMELEEPRELKSRVDLLNDFSANKLAKETTLEAIQTLVDLRDATILETGKDPCVTGNFGLAPDGSTVEPEYGEEEKIEEQFNYLKDMIKESNGDPEVFRQFVLQGLKK